MSNVQQLIELLDEIDKLLIWHRRRNLLPYDWDEYEGQRWMKVRNIVKRIKDEC